MAIVLVAITAISVNVLGQTTESERQALLDEANAASEAEDHPRALSLAMRAGEIRMTPSLRRFIAEEQYAVGQLSDSMKSAELCLSEAAGAKVLNNRAKILRACKDLIAELQKSAARLVISMPDPVPPQTEVVVSGQVIPESVYGLPYLFSSGEIRVEAKAPGHVPFQRDLVVGPGQEVTVKVSLPPEPAVAPGLPPESQEAKVVSEPTIVSAEPPKRTSNVGPYVVIGTGAASLGASAVFLVLRNKTVNDLKAQCTGPNHTVCPDTPAGHELQSKASTYNALTNVAIGVGGAALVAGTIWLLFQKTHNSGAAPRAELKVAPTEGGATLAVEGAL
jgi:hypothetical protein